MLISHIDTPLNANSIQFPIAFVRAKFPFRKIQTRSTSNKFKIMSPTRITSFHTVNGIAIRIRITHMTISTVIRMITSRRYRTRKRRTQGILTCLRRRRKNTRFAHVPVSNRRDISPSGRTQGNESNRINRWPESQAHHTITLFDSQGI